MNVFVTGASGWIGSAVVRELLENGHQVLGLARSDSSAAAVEALGAQVHRGGLDDPESLRVGAAQADGVVHLAYNHDFSDMAGAAVSDLHAVEAIGAELEGSGRPFLVFPDAGGHPRIPNAAAALALASRGVRSSIVRFAPTVHGAGDHGFVATLVGIARASGVSGYVGDGSSRWPAVHRDDAAVLVRLGLESAPAGSVLHAVAEEGVRSRDIADAIGLGLGVPVQSAPAEHFDWLGRFFGTDCPTSNTLTRELLGWEPKHPTLLEDLATGSYFS